MKNLVKYFILKKKGLNIKFRDSNKISIHTNIGCNVSIFGKVEISPDVSIGDYSYINDGARILSGKIGRFCSIAYNCIIGPPEHPTEYIFTHPIVYDNCNIKYKKFEFSQREEPIIEDNVWIGANSIILRGVKISEGSIIAANSVVTKDVKPYEIVGGSPAKVLKNRKEFYKLEPESLKNMDTNEILSYILKI